MPIGDGAVFQPASLYQPFESQRGCQLRHNTAFQVSCNLRNFTQQSCLAAGCCYQPGSGSQRSECFQPAGMPPEQFHSDVEFIFQASPNDELVPWYNQGGWTDTNHCTVTGPLVGHLRLPPFTTIRSDTPGRTRNNAFSLLQPDNETLFQSQPAYRCGEEAPLLLPKQKACTDCRWNQSIYGNGSLGCHGGSGLSGIGGSIREGELLPTAGPIRHALKIELFAHDYYFGDPNATCYPTPNCTYRWPAVRSDGYTFNDNSDRRYNGSNPQLMPGALLAIPSSVASRLNVSTTIGQKIKQALVGYGAYVVDDTAWPTAGICLQAGVNEELEQHYNMTLSTANPPQPGHPLYQDLLMLFRALHIVTNNSPWSVGGGGRPLQSLAPPLCSS
eukprot:TRINITY_DN11742_c0_g2_i12.p1 TRINITY_DN11742_c0_g2~~TRINITY_DN11742_c0_g2_i12.p1  ORF type:complete len:434 (+),score=71.08 TRINITY_DN11742_c0_g2_i12:142-1302(+)